MAEGRARLTQQVVDIDYWTETNRVVPRLDHPWSPIGSNERERRLDEIRQVVENDILPRVTVPHVRHPDRPVGVVAGADVLGFVKILLAHDEEAVVAAHVAAVQARGVSVDDIYLHLFQPAARHIGDLWCDDLCSFVDVTLAVGTMQKLLRTLGPIFHRNGRAADGSRLALMAPLPGDQHTFGLSMVAEFLRRAGWSVWSAPFDSRESLGETVGKLWFAVVGFSVGSAGRLDELTSVIRQIRRESCNSAVRILVGGPLFVENPDYVVRVGADAMGVDAVQALTLAESFVAAGS